jgi:hypothetical protein
VLVILPAFSTDLEFLPIPEEQFPSLVAALQAASPLEGPDLFPE